MGSYCSRSGTRVNDAADDPIRKGARLVFPQPRSDVDGAGIESVVDLDSVVEECTNFSKDSPRIRTTTPSPLVGARICR